MAFSNGEIAIIKGMLNRGDVQSHIAAYFGSSNSGRISEINTGQKGADIAPAPADELPPSGPYFVSGRSIIHATETLVALRELIDQTLEEMKGFERGSE